MSTMTVSLALRGDKSRSRVSEATRQRVLDAAKALRYHPNARGRALRSGYTNVIGLYAGYGYVNVRVPFFTEVVSGLQEGCELFKKDLLLHGIFHGNTPEDIYTELADGRIDGLVVNIPADDPLAKRLTDVSFPVVAIAEPLTGVPSVVVDDAAGSRLLAQHLISRGYRRFVYVSRGLPAVNTIRRRDAFLEAAAEAGLEVEEIPDPGSDGAFSRCLHSLDRQPRPAAVVFWNDSIAFQWLAKFRRHGIRVPEDIAVAGFGGSPTTDDGAWTLTTIRAPWAAAARLAVQYLNDQLEGRTVPPETVLPVELISGHTA